MRAYAKQQKESLEMQNNIAEIKIRCERRIGDFSKELETVPANQYTIATQHNVEKQKTEVLKQAGLNPNTVHRFESISAIPEEVFEKHIAETKEKKGELTTASMIRIAKHIEVEAKATPF